MFMCVCLEVYSHHYTVYVLVIHSSAHPFIHPSIHPSLPPPGPLRLPDQTVQFHIKGGWGKEEGAL